MAAKVRNNTRTLMYSPPRPIFIRRNNFSKQTTFAPVKSRQPAFHGDKAAEHLGKSPHFPSRSFILYARIIYNT